MVFFRLHNQDCVSPHEIVAYRPDNFAEIDKLPVIIFLHGSAERGLDPGQPLKDIGYVVSDYWLPALVMFPQCHPDYRAFYGEMEERVLFSINRAINELNGDPKRIYLIGFSMGGSSCLWLAARHPELFAGIVCIAPGITWIGAEPPPRFPTDVTEMFESMFVVPNRMEGIAKNVHQAPIWFIQGTHDEPCPIDETRTLITELRKLGSDPKVTEYEGAGHDILSTALREPGLFDWLFAQHR
ncbi:MAG: alpha/beta fold hydrolase [Candidatus Melainabacteria bacterium]|nr:alpha/beta fold hydrolase [Candidatus Melainabacteria bacterium]